MGAGLGTVLDAPPPRRTARKRPGNPLPLQRRRQLHNRPRVARRRRLPRPRQRRARRSIHVRWNRMMRSLIPVLILLAAAHSLDSVPQATITVHSRQITNHVSRWMTGACLEDVNHEVYGGLYSQMIFGESFQ